MSLSNSAPENWRILFPIKVLFATYINCAYLLRKLCFLAQMNIFLEQTTFCFWWLSSGANTQLYKLIVRLYKIINNHYGSDRDNFKNFLRRKFSNYEQFHLPFYRMQLFLPIPRAYWLRKLENLLRIRGNSVVALLDCQNIMKVAK